MAVAYDNSVTVDTFGDTTLTSGTFTVSSSANRAIAGCLSTFALTTLHSMTLAGQTGTAISGATLIWNAAGSRMLMFGAAAPNTGSQTVSASWVTSTSASLGGITATGVDQTTPFNNGTSTEGASPASLAVTSAAGDLTFTLASNNTSSTTHTSNQTVRLTDFGIVDTGPGTANPTHTWTEDSTIIGIVGANFQAVAAAGRTTKNTRSAPLGVEIGMNWRGGL